MGCGSSLSEQEKVDKQVVSKVSSKKSPAAQVDKSDKTIKAALLIQKWYRRYIARLEIRRRYTWTIFQQLEYAGEQDQLRLYNFFHDLMDQLKEVKASGKNPTTDLLTAKAVVRSHHTIQQSMDEEDATLLETADPDSLTVPNNYTGPHISLPMTSSQVETLIKAFKKRQVLHAHYVLEILHAVRKVFKEMPNISKITAKGPGQQLTVCGDLHGKLGDLLTIFFKNGLPDVTNPYLFNGDVVDRGPFSVEICVLLFSFILLNPNSVYINRGNHEDYMVNMRYGFTKELTIKYPKPEARKLRCMFEDVFSWLPLATVIDKKILVMHGGISATTDMYQLQAIDRHRYLSVLEPPNAHDEGGSCDMSEWKQMLDLLWSDPMKKNGCKPNTLRNGGSLWGPNVTRSFLNKHKLRLLIRSHECKQEGYEFTHNNMVLTIFSASNYYDVNSNKGAYVKLGPDLEPRIVQFVVTKESQRRLTFGQKVDNIEASALRVLKTKLCAHKTELMAKFETRDPNRTGLIKPAQWCEAVQSVMKMDVPWLGLRTKLVATDKSGNIQYESTFSQMTVTTKLKSKDEPGVSETLYRHKDALEVIFRAIDKDNSGFISMEEFTNACDLLGQHTQSKMPRSDIQAMARNMDLNKDGQIDFNEFLEAFRMVDKFGEDVERRRFSQDSVNQPGDWR